MVVILALDVFPSYSNRRLTICDDWRVIDMNLQWMKCTKMPRRLVGLADWWTDYLHWHRVLKFSNMPATNHWIAVQELKRRFFQISSSICSSPCIYSEKVVLERGRAPVIWFVHVCCWTLFIHREITFISQKLIIRTLNLICAKFYLPHGEFIFNYSLSVVGFRPPPFTTMEFQSMTRGRN